MKTGIEQTFLDEASGAAPVKKGKRWLVTVAVPGTGSRGIYSEQVLKETGPSAFPPGTKAFWGHESRDARDMVGTYDEGAFWNDEEGKLQAFLTPFPRYAAVLDEAGSNIEASIHAHSNKDERTQVVLSLNPNRGNTVDLVAFGGLEGSRLEYQVESLFAAAAAEAEPQEEQENYVFEITKEMWDESRAAVGAITAKFDTLVAESRAEVQGVADEAAVEAKLGELLEEALGAYEEVSVAIETADILPSQKESLKAKARKGEDITDELASAVSFVAEAKTEFAPASTAPVGYRKSVIVTESMENEKPTSFSVGQWGKK